MPHAIEANRNTALPARGKQSACESQGVGVDDPGGTVNGEVEIPCDPGQGDNDDGHVERHQENA
jgi:hypothetical protein